MQEIGQAQLDGNLLTRMDIQSKALKFALTNEVAVTLMFEDIVGAIQTGGFVLIAGENMLQMKQDKSRSPVRGWFQKSCQQVFCGVVDTKQQLKHTSFASSLSSCSCHLTLTRTSCSSALIPPQSRRSNKS